MNDYMQALHQRFFREGKPIAHNPFAQRFKQFLWDNDLRKICLHDLRHTCASALI